MLISIHALREEGDRRRVLLVGESGLFQSTPSARRATGRVCCRPQGVAISIHALREEGDHTQKSGTSGSGIFQSTPSARRATHRLRPLSSGCRVFQSTPSARRATREIYAQGTAKDISIHALREEGDQGRLRSSWSAGYFNPRPPRGGRPGCLPSVPDLRYFNPRPPRGGRRFASGFSFSYGLFQSTPSARRATHSLIPPRLGFGISIHALREEGDRSNSKATAGRNAISIHALREEGDQTPAIKEQ